MPPSRPGLPSSLLQRETSEVMATSRSGRLIDPGTLTGFPDLKDVIGAPEPWYEDAACRDEQDESLFVHDPSSYSAKGLTDLTSPSRLVAMLICSNCGVREQCLRAALDPPSFRRDDETHQVGIQRVFGTWGGTTERERQAMHGVSTEAVIESFQTSFSDRLQARIDAWRAATAKSRGTLRATRLSARDRRVVAMLGDALLEAPKHVNRPKTKKPVGRFTLGGPPGPGRGKRGPIATYVAEHGCSRDTAWRRLRAAGSTT